MKTAVLAGILLVVLGVISLAYQGVSYTRQKQVLKVGPIEATRNTRERIPLPPLLGGIALTGGIVLIVIGARRGT
ncbi:MAG TPA: DUF3185 domain-containing protein [Terriglobia bacterium]|jgi:hypothetical protein|nr:DUF3185 domain-containing protein [Terriglobia bacterium]